MKLEEYVQLDASAMADLINKKEITSSELIHTSMKQLEKVNPTLHAVTHDRKESALQEAAKHQENGATFSGVPLLLKNSSQAIKGEPITSGAKLLRSNIAKADSNLVKKFREAGFIFTGHTNTPEFGLKNISESELYEATRNPWNTTYSPGGSSGGSAAAIAAGIVPVAGASDGGGSIRIPASFTGLFGLKPTRGRTPVGPGSGRQWHGAAIDFVLSRSVRDSAALLNELQVIQAEAAFQTPLYEGNYLDAWQDKINRPLRIAFSTKSPVGTPVSPEAVKAVEKAVKWLEAEGHLVEERADDVDGMELMRNYFLMNSGEISALMTQLEGAIGREITADDVEIETWVLHQAGKSVSAAEFSLSLASWDTAAAQMAAFHQTYDFYITPASAYPAPKVGELTHTKAEQEKLRAAIERVEQSKQQELIYDMFLPSLTYTPFTQLANLTGQPSISLPVHLTEEGLPLGVQVTAAKGAEYKLLQLAFQIEQSDLWIGNSGEQIIANMEKYL